jgi:hypothetical protein
MTPADAGGENITRTTRDPHRGHRSRLESWSSGKCRPRVHKRIEVELLAADAFALRFQALAPFAERAPEQ